MITSAHRRCAMPGWPMVAGLAVLPMLSAAAHASGYQLREQSTTAQGNAYAGAAAGGDDISAMFFNPASMTQFTGNQADLHLTYIAPTAELDGAVASTVLGTSIAGASSENDIAEDAMLSSVYGMWQPSADWRVGVSLNAPFGLATAYDRGWVGRYQAIDSEVKAINVSPQVAWQATPWLALGIGAQAQYTDATLSNSVDFGTIGRAAGISGAVPGSRSQDGYSKVEGDDWGYGYSLGAIVEPAAGTRIGLSYRSQVEHKLRGDVTFDLGTSGVGSALAAATGAFRDTGARASVTTPATVSLGVRQRLSPEWTVMGELDWTEWSVFEELRIEFDNAAQSDSVTDENWEDTWFAALGATYRPADTPWTFRAGVAYDQAPLGTGNRTPRIPDGDRYWLSAGASYQPTPWLSVSAAFTHILVQDTELDLSTSDTGSTFRGNLTGNYENSVNIVTVSAKLRF